MVGGTCNQIPSSSSMIVAEAVSPPAENWAGSPLLFWIVAVRENVSGGSLSPSLIMVIKHAGVAKVPGPLPELKVVRHVVPRKSPGGLTFPSVVRKELFPYTHTAAVSSSTSKLSSYYPITYL